MQDTQVRSQGQEDPLEKKMVTHSSVLAWEIPWTVACQVPLTVEFIRQEYWSGSPFSSPGDLPSPEMEPASLTFPILTGGFFTASAT